MRINLPLLPILIDVRWRPLRPCQFSVRGMMLATGVAGFVFSLGANALWFIGNGNQHSYQHTYNSIGLHSDWHGMMAQRYHHAGWILSVIFWTSLMILAALGMAAAFGRILNAFHRQSAMPSQE